MQKRLKIVITGRIRSGKSTVMSMFKELAKNNYGIELKHIRMADPLYTEVKEFYDRHGIPFRKFRKMFDAMGEALSEHGDEDMLLKHLREKHNLDSDYIIDDARRIVQADFLEKDGAVFIAIEAPTRMRKKRCASLDEWTEGHISDIELDDHVPDHLIFNGGTISDLRRNVICILDEIMAEQLLDQKA